jgi:hypothetical protein
MSDEIPIPPQPSDLKPSNWVMSVSAVTAAIVGGVAGLAVLLFGDAFFTVGPDPAIPVQQVREQVQSIDRRIQSLEQKAQTGNPDVTQLQSDISRNAEQTAALQQKVDTLNAQPAQKSQENAILLGLTQLKTAYDYNMPLQPGIETLKSTIEDQDIRKTLDELNELAGQGLPSNEKLLDLTKDLEPATQPAPASTENLTWKDRVKGSFDQFVTVKPAATLAEQTTVHNIRQAIVVNDMTTASSLIQSLPPSPASKILLAQIKIRLQAQQLMHDTVNKVTRLATFQKGGLY